MNWKVRAPAPTLSIRDSQSTWIGAPNRAPPLDKGVPPLDIRCAYSDECQFVRGHDGDCSPDALKRAQDELREVKEALLVETLASNRLQQDVETLTDLIDAMNSRNEEDAAGATMSMAQKLAAVGIEGSKAIDLALELIESARAHLREEFKRTMARNLVWERDQLRKELDDLKKYSLWSYNQMPANPNVSNPYTRKPY